MVSMSYQYYFITDYQSIYFYNEFLKLFLIDRIQSSFLLSDFIKQINLIWWWSKWELVSIHTMPHRYEATDCSMKERYFSKLVLKNV